MPVTYDPSTVDMTDFPANGYAYDDPFAYPSHNNKKVIAKELAQIQAAALLGRRFALIGGGGAGTPGVNGGTLNGLPRKMSPAISTQVLTKSASYRLRPEDYGALVIVTATATITLPSPRQVWPGWTVTIKKTAAAATLATIARYGSETIDARSVSDVLYGQNAMATYKTDGVNWFVEAVNDYMDARQTSVTNYVGTDTFSDGATLTSIPPGEWSLDGACQTNRNGATVTIIYLGIGTASGTGATGLVIGDNYFQGPGPVGTVDAYCFVPGYRVYLTASADRYLKVAAGYSVATPQYRCRISARRVG